MNVKSARQVGFLNSRASKCRGDTILVDFAAAGFSSFLCYDEGLHYIFHFEIIATSLMASDA